IKDFYGNTNLIGWKNIRNEDTPQLAHNLSNGDLSVHPGPTTGVAIGWKSPVSGKVKISGRVADADAAGGDGFEWTLAQNGKRLAGEALVNGSSQNFGDEKNPLTVEVSRGEMIELTILPRATHIHDTTLIGLEIAELAEPKRVWNLTNEVAKHSLQQNPSADSLGNAEVWHFIDVANTPKSFTETNSLLTKFIAAVRAKNSEAQKFAEEIQRNLETNANANLQEDLVSARGAFWSLLRDDGKIFSTEGGASWKKSKAELSELRNNPPPPIALAHGMQEGGTPESPHAGIHDVKIHVRGRYDRLGEIVPRKFPRILAGDEQKPITEGSGRLQLAKWLTSGENPLTARVMVNRIW
ncbi:MAG: DUF1553 domain-containing protein, partial [Limisphaerales bacterium]